MEPTPKSLDTLLEKLDAKKLRNETRVPSKGGVFDSSPLIHDSSIPIIYKRLDSLAKLLTGQYTCAAISFFNNKFYYANNSNKVDILEDFHKNILLKSDLKQKDVLDWYLDFSRGENLLKLPYFKEAFKNWKNFIIKLAEKLGADNKILGSVIKYYNQSITIYSNRNLKIKNIEKFINFLVCLKKLLKDPLIIGNSYLVDIITKITYPLKLCKKVHQLLTSEEDVFKIKELTLSDGASDSAIRGVGEDADSDAGPAAAGAASGAGKIMRTSEMRDDSETSKDADSDAGPAAAGAGATASGVGVMSRARELESVSPSKTTKKSESATASSDNVKHVKEFLKKIIFCDCESDNSYKPLKEKKEEDPSELKALAGISSIAVSASDSTKTLHAEMRILNYMIYNIMTNKKTAGEICEKIYMSITKQCCFTCGSTIEIVNDNKGDVALKNFTFMFRSIHNKVYKKWKIPKFLLPKYSKADFLTPTGLGCEQFCEVNLNHKSLNSNYFKYEFLKHKLLSKLIEKLSEIHENIYPIDGEGVDSKKIFVSMPEHIYSGSSVSSEPDYYSISSLLETEPAGAAVAASDD